MINEDFKNVGFHLFIFDWHFSPSVVDKQFMQQMILYHWYIFDGVVGWIEFIEIGVKIEHYGSKKSNLGKIDYIDNADNIDSGDNIVSGDNIDNSDGNDKIEHSQKLEENDASLDIFVPRHE
jgi:hypothetical protein